MADISGTPAPDLTDGVAESDAIVSAGTEPATTIATVQHIHPADGYGYGW